eukprot:2377594-Rhodomonas_salina.1
MRFPDRWPRICGARGSAGACLERAEGLAARFRRPASPPLEAPGPSLRLGSHPAPRRLRHAVRRHQPASVGRLGAVPRLWLPDQHCHLPELRGGRCRTYVLGQPHRPEPAGEPQPSVRRLPLWHRLARDCALEPFAAAKQPRRVGVCAAGDGAAGAERRGLVPRAAVLAGGERGAAAADVGGPLGHAARRRRAARFHPAAVRQRLRGLYRPAHHARGHLRVPLRLPRARHGPKRHAQVQGHGQRVRPRAGAGEQRDVDRGGREQRGGGACRHLRQPPRLRERRVPGPPLRLPGADRRARLGGAP